MTVKEDTPPTIEDYWSAVGECARKNKSWRSGQVAFNVLWDLRPDLSEQVRATPLDPFHFEALSLDFINFIEENWEK